MICDNVIKHASEPKFDPILEWALGRTGLGYWIDHLPGVLLLKLDRTDIAES